MSHQDIQAAFGLPHRGVNKSSSDTKLSADARALKAAVQGRGISRVVHFTPLHNLTGIFVDEELRTRADLESDRGADAVFPDKRRIDGLPETVSLSITSPNWYLFKCKRGPAVDASESWCVLELEPALLWELPALFCERNAASVRPHNEGAKRCRRGADGFEQLFADRVWSRRVGSPGYFWLERQPLGLRRSEPTDAQAEVLVEGKVPQSYLRRICVSSIVTARTVERMLGSIDTPIEIEEDLFRPRHDNAHWHYQAANQPAE